MILHDVKSLLWEDPLLFNRSLDQVIRRFVVEDKMLSILKHCHSSKYGGHFGATKTTAKVL